MKNLALLSLSLLASLPVSAQYKAAAKELRRDIQAVRVKSAAEEVKDSAQDLGAAASELAGDAAHLAAETAHLAKDQIVATGSALGEKAAVAGHYVERRAEQAAHNVASGAGSLATAVDNFATVTSVSAVSQVAQAGCATAQFVDKLIYPATFTAAGYYTYVNHIAPRLPSVSLETATFETQHPTAHYARKAGASLLTGGVLFAGIYGLLTCPKIATFLNKNMPETASLLAHVVGRERTLILERLDESSL